MPRADVVVIGAGLAGLACAAELAERGAAVFVAAKGLATTHWTHGGIDVAAPPGAATPREGVGLLARRDGHPYALLATDLDPAVGRHLERLSAAGLPHAGSVDTPLVRLPTALGTLRPAAILPGAQAAGLAAWDGGVLAFVGFDRYRDAWPAYAARNLATAGWSEGPGRVVPVSVTLPDTLGRRNLNARSVAEAFDDPAWRRRALDATARAIPAEASRVAVPAVLGIDAHAEAHAEAEARIGRPVLEIPSLPPSVPGMRLFDALRRRILEAGGRIQIGFDVVRVERDGSRVIAVHTEAASRTLRLAADAFVLATGGLAGAGLRATPAGEIVERVFGLAVNAPPRDRWFGDDPLLAHPLEAVGIDVDAELRPAGLDNVRVIGSALAGMRYLDERCGDGVALASAHRAARVLSGSRAVAA